MSSINLNNDITDVNYHFPDDIICNSSLCRKLRELPLYNTTFKVSQKFVHRDDLIARELYQNEMYGWILLFINGLTREELVLGVELRYTPLSYLNSILIEYDQN